MIYQLFPTQILHKPLFKPNNQLVKDLKEEALKLAEIDEEGQDWCVDNYPFGYTSYGSMDQLHLFSTTFGTLKKALDKTVREFIKQLEMDIAQSELRMSKCWVNVMNKNCHHSMHIHPLSVISGSFYVFIPKTGGKKAKITANAIKFEDPRMDQFMATPTRLKNAKQQNQRFFHIQPKAGDVVLFESWTRHEVPRIEDSEKRISISFNYDWK